MKTRTHTLSLLLLPIIMMTASTDLAAQKPLTLEHLLGGGNQYHQMVPENKHLTWWGNTALETRAEEVADADGGKVLFSIEDLNQWAGKKIAYSGHNTRFPYEGEPLVLVTGARERTLIDFTRHTVEWTQSIPEGAANQDWNPQSRNLAYTVKGNLYVQTADGKTLQVTTDGSTDGSDNIVYGTSVHRNEWGIEKGTFWSPDGKKLAFYRMDQSMVPSYPQVDITTRIATTYTDHYPMAGERSHEVKVGIYDVEAGTTTWMDLVGEKEDYHTNLSWAPDGKTLYVFELNRRQNHMRLMAYDTATGQPLRELLSEKDDKYVEPMHELAFLPWDEGKAIMQSQRDGYNHLYVLDVNSGQARQLTRGPWVVQQMVGFNTRQKSVIYRSNERDPRYSCLYAVSVKTGKTTPLGDQEGVHSATCSADGSRVIDSWSSPSVPRSVNLVETAKGKAVNLLTAADPWKEQGFSIPEITSGSIKAADGVTDLFFRMVLPVGFDSTKKYPAVVYVYGGPHAHNVQASWHWGMRGWEAYMAQLGYVLFILDNRGSEWRGLAFEQATWHQLGVVEMQDQLQGVEYLKSQPWVDAQRLGVHGWSFGGFMTSSLMCTYPDVFKVGGAGGPVIDWKYYEVMYGERYMGTPQDNPEGYASTSLLGKAGNLKGRLQVILGYNDPTCVPQHSLSFIRACEDAGTQPDLFLYPGQGHNMYGRDQIHLHERITRYFEDYLK